MEGCQKSRYTVDAHSDIRIFSKFSTLNIYDLLYFQAKTLHNEWHDTVLDNVKSNDDEAWRAEINEHLFNLGRRTSMTKLLIRKEKERKESYSTCLFVWPAFEQFAITYCSRWSGCPPRYYIVP